MESDFDRARMLPKLIIEGTAFFVDIRLSELREVDAPWNCLRFNDLFSAGIPETDGYLCLYNSQTKNIAAPPKDPLKKPDHMVWIDIPGLVKLDPVGLARKYGLHDNNYTKEYPIRPVQQAKRIITEQEIKQLEIKKNATQKKKGRS